jgi:hypothetical protein
MFKPPPFIPKFPHLFYTNQTTLKHNDKIFEQTTCSIYCFQAKYNRHDMCPFCFTLSKVIMSKTVRLHYELHLKPNMLIKLCAQNYCIEDGFVNGAEGILKTTT